MAMADTYDAGLFEGDIALTVEDIAEMNDLDMVSSYTVTNQEYKNLYCSLP